MADRAWVAHEHLPALQYRPKRRLVEL